MSQTSDTAPHSNLRLDRAIRSLLAGLRRRIRVYVWLEGLALTLIWLGGAFWTLLAIDYLPVRLGSSEMPVVARAIALVLVIAVALGILYRWVLRRTLVRLSDRSMAILLERQFPEFHDSLVTVVELAEAPEHAHDFNQAMLRLTDSEAHQRLKDVRQRHVFNFRPLLLAGLGSLLVAGSVAAFAALATDTFALGVGRLYALSEQKWPRAARIEIVGIEVRHVDRLATTEAPERIVSRVISFDGDRTARVAKGSSVTLLARAKTERVVAGAVKPRPIPRYCTMHYRLEEGRSGSVRLEPAGAISGGHQRYEFGSRPLKNLLSSLAFDLVGSDHRLSDYCIEVVDAPALANVRLVCDRPAYAYPDVRRMETDFRPGMQLPQGTTIKLDVTSNKPLKRVQIYRAGVDKLDVRQFAGKDATRFPVDVGTLEEDLDVEITLLDTDGVYSTRPFRIMIGAREDQAPEIDVALRGISTAVTPNARLPLTGAIKDDYAVAESWFAVGVDRPFAARAPGGPPVFMPLRFGWLGLPRRMFRFDVAAEGEVAAALDLREQRSRDDDPMELLPGDRLHVTVEARDYFDLAEAPNVGAGDPYQLDVVTPDRLLARLDAAELGLRRRFEQNIIEMRDLRDSLLRFLEDAKMARAGTDAAAGGEPGDAPPGAEPDDSSPRIGADLDAGAEPGDTSADHSLDHAERLRRLQALRVQSAIQLARKQANELEGLASAFRSIREELINNRVDTPERESRLEQKIAVPLDVVAKQMCPQLDRRLVDLEALLTTPEEIGASETALTQAEDTLLEMERILQQMLDLETYNELVELLRTLIEEEEKLTEETKRQRKKQLLDLE